MGTLQEMTGCDSEGLGFCRTQGRKSREMALTSKPSASQHFPICLFHWPCGVPWGSLLTPNPPGKWLGRVPQSLPRLC